MFSLVLALFVVAMSLEAINASNNAEKYYYSCITGDSTGSLLIAGTSSSMNQDGFRISTDGGVTWDSSVGSEDLTCSSIDSDSTAQHVYACKYGGTEVHISNDFGRTWTSKTVSSGSTCKAIATSSDGSFVVGVIGNKIWLSSDYGDTWEVNENLPDFSSAGYAYDEITDVGMTPKGDYVGFTTLSHGVYVSSNNGKNFTPSSSLVVFKNFQSIAFNENASYIFASYNNGDSDHGYYGGVAVSTDFGLHFESPYEEMPINATAGWLDVTINPSGQYVMVISEDKYDDRRVVMSADYGRSFTFANLPTNRDLSCMYMNDDVSTIVVTLKSNQPFISHDTGENYATTQSPWGSWSGGVMHNGDIYALNGGVYKSTDNGETWGFQRGHSGSYMAVDGAGKHIAVSNFENLYTSSDYGVTWVTHEISTLTDDTSSDAGPVAMSKDGQYQVLLPSNYGYIFVSNDYGVTFEKACSLITYWSNVACDDSGKYMLATMQVGVEEVPYASNDYGVTWNALTLNVPNTFSVAISSTGQYQYFATITTPTYLYASLDYGVTWTNQTLTSDVKYVSLDVSSDGGTVVVSTSQHMIVSTDYGNTWSQRDMPDDAAFQPYTYTVVDEAGEQLLSWGYELTLVMSKNLGLDWIYV